MHESSCSKGSRILSLCKITHGCKAPGRRATIFHRAVFPVEEALMSFRGGS